MSIGHFSTRNQCHSALWAVAWARLAHLWMHGTGPITDLGRLFLVLSRFLLWWLAPWHMHGKGTRTWHVHIALHRPHHLTSWVHHNHDHEEHHDEHTAHIHHDLNSGQK